MAQEQNITVENYYCSMIWFALDAGHIDLVGSRTVVSNNTGRLQWWHSRCEAPFGERTTMRLSPSGGSIGSGNTGVEGEGNLS